MFKQENLKLNKNFSINKFQFILKGYYCCFWEARCEDSFVFKSEPGKHTHVEAKVCSNIVRKMRKGDRNLV